ncbi:hypothetical protein D3C75_416200 [compost metagenome]
MLLDIGNRLTDPQRLVVLAAAAVLIITGEHAYQRGKIGADHQPVAVLLLLMLTENKIKQPCSLQQLPCLQRKHTPEIHLLAVKGLDVEQGLKSGQQSELRLLQQLFGLEHHVHILNILDILVAMGNTAVNQKHLAGRNRIFSPLDNMHGASRQNNDQLREIMAVYIVIMGQRTFLDPEGESGLESDIPR